MVYFLVHVDDILVAAETAAGVAAGKSLLTDRFNCRDLGEVATFLGMSITRDRAAGTVTITSPGHVAALLHSFQMSAAKPNHTPMSAGARLQPTGEHPLEEGNRYAEAVGSLLYLSTTTRPDVAYAVGVLSRYMSCPEEQHWRAVKGVMRYLVGTRDVGLVFGGGDPLQGYCDSDFAGDVVTRRSTTGYLFTLYGGPVSWRSKLQATVASSTAEAEYMAAAAATKEALWLQKLMRSLEQAFKTVPIGEDNQACIAMAANPVGGGRAKHVDVAHHLVRERVASGDIALYYLPSGDMPADGFTKALPAPAFRVFRSRVGVGRDKSNSYKTVPRARGVANVRVFTSLLVPSGKDSIANHRTPFVVPDVLIRCEATGAGGCTSSSTIWRQAQNSFGDSAAAGGVSRLSAAPVPPACLHAEKGCVLVAGRRRAGCDEAQPAQRQPKWCEFEIDCMCTFFYPQEKGADGFTGSGASRFIRARKSDP